MTTGRLVRASGGLALARAATLGLQALHFAVVARVLGPRPFAGFVAATALVVIAGALAEFGLVNTTVLALQRRPDETRPVLADAVAASWLLTGASVAVAALVARLVLPGEGWFAFCLLVPWVVAVGLQQPFLAFRRHGLHVTRLAIADVTARAVPVLALLPLVLGGRWAPGVQLTVVALGLLAGAVVGLAVLYVPGSRPPPGSGRSRRALRMVRDTLPVGTTSAVSFVHTRVDQVVLSGYGFNVQLGAYAVAYRLLDAVLALVVAASGATLPMLAQASTRDRRSLAAANAALLGAVALVAGVATFALAPQLTVLLGGERYRSSAWFARLLSPALVLSVLNVGAATLVLVEGQARRLARIAGAAVTLNLALNLVLVPHHGARAAAVATVVSEAFGFGLVARLARRSLPRSLPLATLFVPMGGFVAASFGALAVWRAIGPLAGVMAGVTAMAASGAGLLRAARSGARAAETPPEDASPAPPVPTPATGPGLRPAVDVVVLTWNDGDLLERAVGSALASEDVDVNVVVVDNGSDPPATVPADDRVRLVRNARNRGVAPGRNQGVAEGCSPLVCVLDSDAVLHPSALRALTAPLDAGSDVALAAPVFTDQVPEASAGRAPTFLRKAARALNLTSTYRRVPRAAGDPCWEVDFAIGACQLFRRSAFDAVGGMDEAIFYGPEDVDFCLRLRGAGWTVVQVAGARCDHPARRRNRRLLTPRGARHAAAVVRHLWRHRARGERGEGRWRPSMSS